MPLPTALLQQGLIRKRLFPITIFGIAMGLLEAVVVVYLRQIYYPEGFAFPLKPLTPQSISLESLRELSTIVMLITVSMSAGHLFIERFSFFLYTFGIWDIFYYVWLKVFLDWPPSFFTWDILFLIPVVWTGPVLAPVICSIIMIVSGGDLLFLNQKGYTARIQVYEWALLFIGALALIITFAWDFLKIIIQGGFISRFWRLASDGQFQQAIADYIPGSFNWTLFILGEGLILIFLVSVHMHAMRNLKD